MSSLIKTDDKSFGYDTESGALINKDESALIQYRLEVQKAKQAAILEKRVTELEIQIKNLTKLIEEKLTNG